MRLYDPEESYGIPMPPPGTVEFAVHHFVLIFSKRVVLIFSKHFVLIFSKQTRLRNDWRLGDAVGTTV